MPDEKPETRWMCFHCLAGGAADNPEQALAFVTFHERHACPALATSYNDPEDGFLVRLARRANLRDAYGDASVPEYTAEFRRPSKPPHRESDYTPGLWLVASTVLGEEVAGGKPYPHICGRIVPGKSTVSGKQVRMRTRQCLACAEEQA